MSHILDPLPENSDEDLICCCYVNSSSQMQIARITNVHNWYFERVVFPGQRLIFEAPSYSYLEIHTGMMASSILSDKIPCQQLIVHSTEADRPFYIPIERAEPEYANK